MGALALGYEDEKNTEIYEYLTIDTDFWMKNDVWTGKDSAFEKSKISLQERAQTRVIADFSTFKNKPLKLEMKYFIIKQLKDGELTAAGCSANYCRAIRNIGKSVNDCGKLSFAEITVDDLNIDESNESETERRIFRQLKGHVIRFFKEFYDKREGLERDTWYALKIPGIKLSAAIKRTKPNFQVLQNIIFVSTTQKIITRRTL